MSPSNSKWIAIVVLVAALCVGCVVNATAELTVQLVKPVVDPGTDPVNVVTNHETPFEAVAYVDTVELADGDVQWQWDFGDGSDVDTADPTTHTYAADGTYEASVTATYGGVQTTVNFTVVVGTTATGLHVRLKEPAIDPSLDPEVVGPNPVKVVTNQDAKFEATAYLDGVQLANGDVQWQWDFDDDTAHAAEDPVNHTYDATGTFNAKATATLGEAQAELKFTVLSGVAAGGGGGAEAPELIFPDAARGVVSDSTRIRVVAPGAMQLVKIAWKRATDGAFHEYDYETQQGDAPPGMGGSWSYDGANSWWETYWMTMCSHFHERWEWKVLVRYGGMPPHEVWTAPASVRVEDTVVTSGNTAVCYDGQTPATISWKIRHRQMSGLSFRVVVDIYALQGTTPLRHLETTQTQLGDGHVDWDGSSESGPAQPKGIYAYKITAYDLNCWMDRDLAKSENLTATVQDSKFYWGAIDREARTLRVTVRYTLSQDAGSCFVRFYGPDLQPLGALDNEPTAGQVVHWSTPLDIAAVGAQGNLLSPLYCVVYATENATSAAANRDSEPKPALQRGTTQIVQLLDLSTSDLFGSVGEANKENPGAYIHFNIDDDSHVQQSAYRWQEAGDYRQGACDGGDDDLVCARMTLDTPPDAHGKVRIQRSAPKLKVWRAPSKGTANRILCDDGVSTRDWDLAVEADRNDFYGVQDPDPTKCIASAKDNLWVEGCDQGSAYVEVRYFTEDGVELAFDRVKYTFIAAVHGWQPGLGDRDALRDLHYHLVGCEWSITAMPSAAYNCMGFSVDSQTEAWTTTLDDDPAGRWLSINQHFDQHDPNDRSFDYPDDVDAFYWAKKHYRPVAAGPPDAEVVYYNGFHAARRMQDCTDGAGKWFMFESKLGSEGRIEHIVDQISGADGVGQPVRYYKYSEQ